MGKVNVNTKSVNILLNGKMISVEPELSKIYQEKLLKKVKFVPHLQSDKSTFELDKENSIARICWRGKVSKRTASKLLSAGLDTVEYQGYSKLLIDRFELIEFDTEARIWIKEMIATHAKRTVHKVSKLAIINAGSSKGKIFSKLANSLIQLIISGPRMKTFDKRDDAVQWLLQ